MPTPTTTSADEDGAPLPEPVSAAIALIKRAFALLAITPRVMTSRQRQRGLKFRKGAEPSIRAVANLSDTHGVVVPGMTTAAMRASIARVEELRAVQSVLIGVLRAVEDEIHVEQGAAYGNALTLYGMLKKVAHRNEEIRATLAPVVAFFSYRHPAVVAERAKAKKTKKAATQNADDDTTPESGVAT